MRFVSLHLGLDNVDRVISHGGAETSEGSSHEVGDDLGGDVLLQVLAGVFVDHEPDALVGGLLHHGCYGALVDSSETVLPGDRVDAVEQVLVLGCRREFVVNQLRLQSLLRRDDKQSFCCTRSQSTTEVRKLGRLLNVVGFDVGIGSKSHVIFRNREHQKSGISFVKSEEASFG